MLVGNQSRHMNARIVELEDAPFIHSLRMDTRLNTYVSAVDSSVDAQTKWLMNYKVREKNREEYYLIIEDRNQQAFGTVRLYDFKYDSFCWGSWMIKKESPSYVAIESALIVYEIAFLKLGFSRSHFDVRKENTKVVKFHEKFGALIVDEDELNYYFNFEKADYLGIKKKYRKFL